MKTHIISIENHDDYISINDKIVWAKTPRILLVWPDHGRIRLLRSDLILILRKAESVGSQIAIVSDETRIVDLCKQVNVSVFSSIPEAQKRAWRRPRKTRRFLLRSLKTPEIGKLSALSEKKHTNSLVLSAGVRFVVFFIGILAVFAIIALFVPSAEVKITPKVQQEQINITIWSNPNIQTINLSGAVPIKKVPIVVEGENITKSTGVERVPTQFASGTVVFRNLTTEKIEIPSGTVVRTISEDNVRFKTAKTVILGAGINEESSVPVIAIDAGVKGNVGADHIQAVEGEIGGNVGVTNPTAISGGADAKATAPSELDYQKAKNDLLKNLMGKALTEFYRQNNPDMFVVLEDLILLDEILTEQQNPAIGIPSDQFQLSIEARYSISYFSMNDIKSLAAQTLETYKPQGYRLLPDTLLVSLNSLPEIDPDSSQVQAEIVVNQIAIEALSESEVLALIVGKPIAIAKANLLKVFEEVDVITRPAFLKRLPFLAFRIKVDINEFGT